jgi:excisionase family DNA binding protein
VKVLAQVAANTNSVAQPQSAPAREFLERQAFEAFKAFVAAVQSLLHVAEATPTAPVLEARPIDESQPSDVITADEAAAFLGVDRNTVYDFAGRGVIPHQRLGKRLLFRRGALVAWLDASLCKATSIRKG